MDKVGWETNCIAIIQPAEDQSSDKQLENGSQDKVTDAELMGL